MKESVKVIFGGIECTIASYDHMLFLEPGLLEYDSTNLTPHQYLSLLFMNLGYNRCPSNMDWIHMGRDILNVPKTEVLDYPITSHHLGLSCCTDLLDFTLVVSNWIRGGLERGRIVDPIKSFLVPNDRLIRYYIENRIKVVKSCVTTKKVHIWDRCDFLTRRLYNMIPTTDPDYFEFSFRNIIHAMRNVHFGNRHIQSAVFASALIDPDIFFNMIRDSEKEVFHTIWNSSNKRTPLVLMDETSRHFTSLFQDAINRRAKLLAEIYYKLGPCGFLIEGKPRNNVSCDYSLPSPDAEVRLLMPVLYKEDGSVMEDTDLMVLRNEYVGIANIPLDEEAFRFIRSHIEEYSLKFLDNKGMDSIERLAAYKRLYYTLNQLKRTMPELMNPKDKFTFSENFYIDPDRFALYKKSRNKFYVGGLDLIIREMNPSEILRYYDVYLGKHVLHSPEEIGDAMDSPPVPYIDIDWLYRYKMGLLIPQQPPSPVMGGAQPQQVTVPSSSDTYNAEAIGEEELYGFDESNMVMD